MNKILKTGINIILLAVVVYLSFRLFNNILEPIKFDKRYEKRATVVKDKMMKIRDVELAYLDTYNQYTANFDTLIDFIKNDSLIVVKSAGTVPDSVYALAKYDRKEAEKMALEMKIIVRDTIRISVRDSLFKEGSCDTLRFIPYTNQQVEFQLLAGTMKTLSKMTRPVFELKAHNNSFAKGLHEQLLINKNDAARDNDEYPGFIVGSMTEVTTAGNWD